MPPIDYGNIHAPRSLDGWRLLIAEENRLVCDSYLPVVRQSTYGPPFSWRGQG